MSQAEANRQEVRKALLRDSEKILEAWEARLKYVQPAQAKAHSDALLRNSLPQLLTVIGVSLDEGNIENSAGALRDVALAHAKIRADMGDFPLGAIIREYSLFRRVIFRHLDSTVDKVGAQARQIINLCIDHTIEISATEFVALTRTQHQTLLGDREALSRDLAYERARLNAVLDQLPVGVSISARSAGTLLYHNQEALNILGHPMLDSKSVADYAQYGALHADGSAYLPEDHPMARAVLRGETVHKEEMLYRRGDGSIRWISVNAAPIQLDMEDEKHSPIAVAVFWDIQEIKDLSRRLAEEKEFAEVTLRAIRDGVVTVDRAGRVLSMNPAAERMIGLAFRKAEGQSLEEIVQLRDEADGRPVPFPVTSCIRENTVLHQRPFVLLQDSVGALHAITTTLAPMHDGEEEAIGAVAILHDASHEWRLWQQLARDATQDPLTGLVNRREFDKRLRRTVESAQRSEMQAALLLLDLDKFKPINDECGHAAGDLMLRELAELIQGQVRDRDTLARLGGDEFGVILEHCPQERALVIADGIREAVQSYQFFCDGRMYSVGVSIGLLGLDDKAPDPGRAVRLADQACYAAKEGGRNRVCVADDGCIAPLPVLGDPATPQALEAAVREGRFLLFGQRIRALSTSGEAGEDCVEVLLRLCNEKGEVLKPEHFLPLAERYDFMPQLDLWVVQQVIEVLQREPQAQEKVWLCTLNLSSQTIADENIMAQILEVLRRNRIETARLGFEISESSTLRNMRAAIKAMHELRAAGSRVILEDAGTSMISFRNLRQLPVDYLKIEGSFFQHIAEVAHDLEIVRSLNDVCHMLGKRTIAQCINDEAVLKDLKEIGVDFAQGYMLASPQGLENALMQR